MSSYVTFGVQYKRAPGPTWTSSGEPHPMHADHIDGDGYVRIETDDPSLAHEQALRCFGKNFAFTYDESSFADSKEKYPLGELGHITADGQLIWTEEIA